MAPRHKLTAEQQARLAELTKASRACKRTKARLEAQWEERAKAYVELSDDGVPLRRIARAAGVTDHAVRLVLARMRQ